MWKQILREIGKLEIRTPSWENLSKVGRDRFVRSSYFWLLFVPIAANLMSQFPDTISLRMPPNQQITFSLDLPFSWQMFFTGAVFFSIANFVYGFFCPDLIRMFPSFAEFKDEGREQEQLKDQFFKYRTERDDTSLANRILTYVGDEELGEPQVPSDMDGPEAMAEYQYEIQLFAEEGFQFTNSKELESHFPKLKMPDEKEGGVFWLLRSAHALLNPRARLACTITYGLGFVFFFVVFLQNCYFVLRMSNLFNS